MTQTNKNIFYILMLIAMCGWGASWVNAKVLSAYVNEYEMIFFRNFFTILTLAPFLVLIKKYFYINKKGIILAFINAILMIAYLKCYFLGTKYGTASLGGALVTTLIPINTFLIMAIFFKKTITKEHIIALFIGAIGVMTILNVWSFNADDIFVISNFYFIVGSLLWPILTIISSKASGTHPLVFSLYIYIFMSVIVSIFFVDFNSIKYENFDTLFWVNIISLAVFSTTFATSMYFIGIEKLGTNEVSSFIFLVPFFAIFLSYVFLDEKLNLYIILGTILTVLAVKLLNNKKVT